MDFYGLYRMYMYYIRIEDMVYVFYIYVLEDLFFRIFFWFFGGGGGGRGEVG